MERHALQDQQAQLEERLAFLERLAEATAAASGAGHMDVDAEVWHPGNRDFRETFMADPLHGYFIQKDKVHHREAWLDFKRRMHENNRVVNYFAGHSDRRVQARQRVLEEKAWRHLRGFEEVLSDEDD